MQFRLVHTGQHYAAELSDVFFEDLELPKPDIELGIGSGSHAEQTGRIMMSFARPGTRRRGREFDARLRARGEEAWNFRRACGGGIALRRFEHA